MRALIFWVAWWFVLALLWLLYQGEYNQVEKVAAACAATLGASVALLARMQERRGLRIEPKWLVRALKVPWQIVREFAIVTRVLARALVLRRQPRDEFRALPFPTGSSNPTDRGRRMFVAMAVTYSPNSYVIDMNEEEKTVLVHDLDPPKPGDELL